ncbi:hypothetical protein uav_031 [Pseudomonas phage UAVern]|uniref:Uncharacterized protein n=1 Tax=Pseudomonas phage UAVern TaxID=2856997 RepID=A0A975YYK9_9CAUD|nr:hypothetical protein uav_031 [Pseudomonas phage UAVern]
MTSDQKINNIRWYLTRGKEVTCRDSKLYYAFTGFGALSAWFGDMTITHEQFRELQAEFQALEKEAYQCTDSLSLRLSS